MEDRVKIPKKIESTLMFQNDHTCCICREKGKDVQIHHILSRNNNNPSNLAVLCLDCHSRVTGSRGLGKKFTIYEIKQYKRDWEFRVKRKRGMIFEPHKTIKKSEINLIHFEIKKSIFEFSAARNMERAKEILDYLIEYYIYEMSGNYILEQMFHIAPVTIINEKKGILMAKHIPYFFGHLSTFPTRNVSTRDIKMLDNAIELLRYQGQLHVEFGEHFGAVKEITRSLFSLYETTHACRLGKQQTKIISSLHTMKKAGKNSYMSKNNLKSSIKFIDYYLQKTSKTK